MTSTAAKYGLRSRRDRVVTGDTEAALNRSTQHVRGEDEECHDADRHESGEAFVEREPRAGIGRRIRRHRAPRDGDLSTSTNTASSTASAKSTITAFRFWRRWPP